MSYTILNKNIRKYDDRTLSELLRKSLIEAADVEIDLEKCIDPLLLEWLVNYDYDTSAQPIGIFFTLITVIAHVTHNINILQWNKIKKKLNLYSFILGISGACKSGLIRPVRSAYTAMIQFLRQYKLGDQDSYNSLVDTFTTAGLYDQLIQSKDVLVIQEEVDTTLHNMGFYFNTGNEGRQLLCSLWEGLDDNKRTKGYRQTVRDSHLTLCGASTGKSFIPLIRECLDDLPTDGVIDRCLILIVPYSRFTRDLLKPKDLRKPTLAQILLCASILGHRELNFDEEAYDTINTYTDDLTHRAATFYRTSPRFTSYLAKQPAQVIKICGLMTIVKIVTNLLSRLNLNLSEEIDQGLNLPFYNELHDIIQQRVPYLINVTKDVVDQAIYMHGFLYEQSERLLHLNTHQNNDVPQIKITGQDLHKHLMREILMMRNLIVMTNAIFSIPGISHVHRTLVKNALQQLVNEHLLLADYFVLTSTNRPIFCYIKRIPKLNDIVDRETIFQKVQQHNLSFDEYMILNNNYSLTKGNRLNESGKKILSMPCYIAACNTTYNQYLNFESTSINQNFQRNTTNQNLPSNDSTLLHHTQHNRHTSSSIRRNKRSISPSYTDSNISLVTSNIHNNNLLNQNIQHNTIRRTSSILSISSEEIPTSFAPIARIRENNTVFDTEQTQERNIFDNTSSSYTTSNKKFFKTGARRRKSTSTILSNISDDSDTI